MSRIEELAQILDAYHKRSEDKEAASELRRLEARVKELELENALKDDIQSILFEVEQAVENGCCTWQIQAAFEAYEAARRLQLPTHGTKDEE